MEPNTCHSMHQLEQVSVSSTLAQTKGLREYTLTDETYTYLLAGSQ